MSKFRDKRISSVIQVEISSLLHRDIKDPRLDGFITITDVTITKDLRLATIYVSVMDDRLEPNDVLKGLISASGFIRSHLGKVLKLKFTPELRFKMDDSIERGVDIYYKIEKIISDDEEKRNTTVDED